MIVNRELREIGNSDYLLIEKLFKEHLKIASKDLVELKDDYNESGEAIIILKKACEVLNSEKTNKCYRMG